MAKGIYLVNPALSVDSVDLTATSELDPKAGQPIPYELNSFLLNVSAVGYSGDLLDHDFEILGTQDRPMYAPLDESGNRYFTAPLTFASMASIVCAAGAKVSATVCNDRLYVVVAEGSTLKVYQQTGANFTGIFTLKATYTGLTNFSGGISAWGIVDNLYIAVANNTDLVVELYRFNDPTQTIGKLSDVLVETDGDVDGISMASSGSTYFVLLLTRLNGSGPNKDVISWYGSLGNMTQRDETIGDTFGSNWSWGGDVRACSLYYTKTLGFIAAVRTGTSTPAKLKLITSTDGDDWDQFENLRGKTDQPNVVIPWADAQTCAITAENKRVAVVRATAAVLDGAATDIKMHLFDGDTTWTAEVDDGGGTVLSGTSLFFVNWRGTFYLGYLGTATSIVIRKCNELTLTDTGYYREIRFGEQMFLAGIEDETQTALFFVANGSITAGDKFRIPGTEFDYKAEHLLDDYLSKVWRGTHGEEQVILFDARSDRGFLVDTFALFRSNFPEINLQMDNSLAFSSPPVDQDMSAAVQTATVTSISKNYAVFPAGTFRDQRYGDRIARHWVVFGTGGIPPIRILSNNETTLFLDGDASGASGTATIFRDSFGYLFTSPVGPYRYLKLTIPALEVPDGYFEASRVLFGSRFAPAIDYRIEWSRRYGQQQGEVELKSGAKFKTVLNLWQRPAWSLTYRHLKENVLSILDFFGFAQGACKLFAWWPEPSAETGNQPVVHPMFFTGDAPELSDLGADAAEVSIGIEGQI